MGCRSLNRYKADWYRVKVYLWLVTDCSWYAIGYGNLDHKGARGLGVKAGHGTNS